MHDELRCLAVGLGAAIHAARKDLVRGRADNRSWRDRLKQSSWQGILDGLALHVPTGTAVRVIETPYNTSTIGRGLGKNELSVRLLGRGERTLTILADVVDGSWNATSGVPWSASTMLAFTEMTQCPTPAEELVLADFKCSLIVPLIGGTLAPKEPAGFYYGVAGGLPLYRSLDGDESTLTPTTIDDVKETRFFLDLFTAQTSESLSIAVDAVTPLLREWADIGRFYGAGMELMALLGRDGTSPGFGGYVAANQKADNLIPTKLLLEGAGAIVTSWWGEPIDDMRLLDRRYVAIAANPKLHRHLLMHLSKTVHLP